MKHVLEPALSVCYNIGSSRFWYPISRLVCAHDCLLVGSLSTIESCVGLNAVNISVGEDLIMEWALQNMSIFLQPSRRALLWMVPTKEVLFLHLNALCPYFKCRINDFL